MSNLLRRRRRARSRTEAWRGRGEDEQDEGLTRDAQDEQHEKEGEDDDGGRRLGIAYEMGRSLQREDEENNEEDLANGAARRMTMIMIGEGNTYASM